MGYNSEAPYAVGLMVGTNWGSVMHNTGFLRGDPWLLMNLNKDTTRFLFFCFFCQQTRFMLEGLVM